MVVRTQISFKTIKLGEGKEDLTAIELRVENTQTSFKTINWRKERVYFYGLKLSSGTGKKN